jgi:hypothetical protein
MIYDSLFKAPLNNSFMNFQYKLHEISEMSVEIGKQKMK